MINHSTTHGGDALIESLQYSGGAIDQLANLSRIPNISAYTISGPAVVFGITKRIALPTDTE